MFDQLIGYLVARVGQEYSAGYRTVATVLGVILFIAGWPALVRILGLGEKGAVILMILLILEIKLIEEKELEQRFGDVYCDYKKKTPFFIPKFWQKC